MKIGWTRKWRMMMVAGLVAPVVLASSAGYAIDDDPDGPVPDDPPVPTQKVKVVFDKVLVHADGDAGSDCGELAIETGVNASWRKLRSFSPHTSCAGNYYFFSSVAPWNTYEVTASTTPGATVNLDYRAYEQDEVPKWPHCWSFNLQWTYQDMDAVQLPVPGDGKVTSFQLHGTKNHTLFCNGSKSAVATEKPDVTVFGRIVNPTG